MCLNVILCYPNRDVGCFLNTRNAGGILFQQVFLSLSSPSSCKVQHRLWHIDPPLGRVASAFNTATSQHINSSTGYASYLLCPKVTAISPLWTAESGWQPSWDEQRSQRTGWPSAAQLPEEEPHFLSVSVIGTHRSADWKLLFTPELINLSALPLDYVHDEWGDGWNLLSEGGLSLRMGSIQTERFGSFAGTDTNVGKSHHPPAQGWKI